VYKIEFSIFLGIIGLLLLVAVAKVLLQLPIVQRLFRLPVAAYQRHNEKIVVASIGFSLLFTLVGTGMCEVLINHEFGLQWLIQPSERLKLVLVLALIFGVVTGGLGIRFLERKLAADDELRQSEEKWRMLFENVQDVYIEETSDGIVTMVSPSIRERLGYCPAEVIGKESSLIYANPDERTELLTAYNAYGTQTNREVQFRDKAGNMRWMTLNAVEKKDVSGGRKIIAVARDITELKQALAEIQKMNLRLEQRVEERTKDLEAFAYTVSHDLKSPLRAIEGYSQFIREDYAKELNPEALVMVDNINDIAMDMITMINKLLEYATTTKLNLTWEKIDMKDMVVTIFDELKMTCPDRIVFMEIGTELPLLFADRILLKQVVMNILSNAVKFTRDRNPARIWVECHRVERDFVFSFRDNGVGFDMEYVQKLFGMFQRLHTKEEFDGVGIGLATVRNLIAKHGGRTWIQGNPGEGATAFFTLPFIEGE
jgi:PAS domain S-box-containing protein